ncbi:MAG: fibronectin type III domain-containing protein [Candidatus Kapaibacterium sp.]
MNLGKYVLAMVIASTFAFITGCQSDSIAPDSLPSPPVNLHVSAVNSTSASFTWDAPADSANIAGYRIWWTNATTSDSADVPAAPTRYTLTGLAPGKPYSIAAATRRGTLLSVKSALAWSGTIVTVQPAAPRPVVGLRASSISASSVALRWTTQLDTGTIIYRAAWKSSVSSDSGSVSNLTSSTVTVSGLKAGETYTFSVYAVRGSIMSVPASIVWTGAIRYGTTTPIRLYETASANVSGLVLDPDRGGPAAISTVNGSVENVQLALYTMGLNNSFIIGTGYSIVEYRNSDKFDPNTFISDSIYDVSGLDAWLPSGSIDTRIPTNGNVRAFTVSAMSSSGRGFFARTGTSGNYHYARIFIRSVNGMLLQGTAPNRYVELEISYQSTPNLPYAKAVPGWHSAAAVAGSQVRR